MKLYIVMAQRKCDYPGQYGPEAIACMTEYDRDENESYLHEQLKAIRDDGETSVAEIVTIDVDSDEITRRLMPETSAIKGAVCDE